MIAKLKAYLSIPATGGLSIYWAIMIGVIFISAYLVGGLIPSRNPAPTKGMPLSYYPPAYTAGRPVLQLGSLTVGGCQGKPAVLFLIDTSDGMSRQDGSSGTPRIDVLKTSLLHFASSMTDRGIIGVMTYSDTSSDDPALRVPLREIGPNRATFQTEVGKLQAGGLSYLKSGFEEAKDVLVLAKQKYPDYQFNLIVVSSGIPQTAECATSPNDPACVCKGTLCFAKDQDPTFPPNIAKEIKDMGVNVFSIGIAASTPEQQAFSGEFQTMMNAIASTPVTRYFTIVPSVSGMKDIMTKAGTSLCLDNAHAISLSTPTPTPTPSPTPTMTPTPTPTPSVAPFRPGADILILIDASNSMAPRIAEARNAAAIFINTVTKNPQNRVAVGKFDEQPGKIIGGFTNNAQTAISYLSNFGIQGNNGTCLECAFDTHTNGNDNNNDARNLFNTQSSPTNSRKIVIILTDGKVNRWINNNGKITDGGMQNADNIKANARQKAYNAMNLIYLTDVWVIDYTNSGLLTSPNFPRGGGQYINAASQNFNTVFQNMADSITYY